MKLLKLFNVVVLTVIFSFAIIAMNNNSTLASSCPSPDTWEKCFKADNQCWDFASGSTPESGCCVWTYNCGQNPGEPPEICPTLYCW